MEIYGISQDYNPNISKSGGSAYFKESIYGW